ncbi:HBR052Cp [Eremothecium sinecaudum]|uniref:HBR052Cp n=1 Tax=Eremothecium sinecaudum TaxID=45286 RepID=A0A109UWV2_9SACH|nr:HBR052Cp [Eremothecium sinecaudum]AMD18953.1 HBR052Cp [Eremothecium sinecaudum]
MSHGEGQSFSLEVPVVLPHENVYQIQVGYKLFKLSGVSLSSDSPSYFTDYFARKEAERRERGGNLSSDVQDILFIDRSPEVFELIYNHLQGYCINVKDEYQYTMLFVDSMYYNLPRLRHLLKNSDYYFACIGGKSYKIPKNLLSGPGNSPNYFDITVDALYAGLEKVCLSCKPIRPPPQSPPYVARSPALFEDLMALLNGVELTLDEGKRVSLIKECRFYRLWALEQRLLKHKIKYDPYYKRDLIVMLLGDLCSKGVGLTNKEKQSLDMVESKICEDYRREESSCKKQRLACDWAIFTYARPYLDQYPRDLIFEIDGMDCVVYFNKRKKTIHVHIRGLSARQFINVFSEVLKPANINIEKYRDAMNLDGILIPCCVSVSDLSINGVKYTNICSIIDENNVTDKIPDFTLGHGTVPGLKLVLMKSMWRLATKDGGLLLVCIRGDGITGINEFHHNIEYL